MSPPGDSSPSAPGPPPLRPFGLVLHHDGSWTHEGVAIRNRKMRAAFDRAVRYLPDAGVFVVQLGRFRGQIEVEEAAFFVRSFDPDSGVLGLSDGSRERLEPDTLCVSLRDGALLCSVKRELLAAGLIARFMQSAQAELLCAIEEGVDGPQLRIGAALHRLPAL